MRRLIHHGPPPAHPLPVRSHVPEMIGVALRATLVLAPCCSLRRSPTSVPADALPPVVCLAQREQAPALPAPEQKEHVHALAFFERAAFFAGSSRRGTYASVGRSPIEGLGCNPRPSSVSLARFAPFGLSERPRPISRVKFLRIYAAASKAPHNSDISADLALATLGTTQQNARSLARPGATDSGYELVAECGVAAGQQQQVPCSTSNSSPDFAHDRP